MRYILLHGLGQAAANWNDTVEAMDCDGEVLCPELADWLRGKDASYENLYQALEDYCEAFHEPVHLCGLSLGGILAMQYGIEHPEKVNSLVLIGMQYAMPKRLLQMQNAIFRILPNTAFEKMGFGKADFIGLCKSMMDLNFKQDLNKIHSRVLIVCGEKDKANKAASLELNRLIPLSEFSIIEHAGHEVNIDNPVGLGKELNSFYRKGLQEI